MNKELISIIVPIYNVENYLGKCIESIISQTYENIEIILVNDGSTDSGLEICEKYEKSDKRIKIVDKKNGGLSDARNYGIDVAKGEYLVFIDSDDFVSNDYIEYLYEMVKEHNAKISVCSFYEYFENGEKKPIGSANENEPIRLLNDEEAIETILYQKLFDHSAWGKMYNKELFKERRFPKGKLYEDIAIMYEILNEAKKIVFGPERKYFYLIRKSSIMNESFNIRKMDLIEYTDRMIEFIDMNYPNLKKAARRRGNISNFNMLRQVLMCNGKYEKIEDELIKKIKANSKYVVLDKKANKRDKIAILVLMLGKKTFRKVWIEYKK
ncbi:glycosyltransferase [uncultured Clostridium sp.]|uniref:glycosyltransferase family 2 protein n=1 Tax=uncultured Clostridium sp. TaxID=59620 RepID=UPI00261F5F9D|nr:glycosyltransferase [uncultured Clostridium sp.]